MDILFKQLKDKHEYDADNGKDNDSFDRMKYDFATDERLRVILNKIINFSDITINIVGSWIWLEGDTYPYKDQLKEMGFTWSRQRKMWYWHNGEYRKKGNKNLSFSDIENKYGSTKVKTEQRQQLQEA